MITNASLSPNATEIVGCPSDQEWCRYTPAMTITQFIIGYGFTTIGYPVGVTLVQTIFSKVLGPRPQGLWMGIMTGAGCAARVLGPVFVGFIYTRWGTYHTFGITGMTLIIAMIWLQIVNKRLITKTSYQGVAVSPEAESPKEVEMQAMAGNTSERHLFDKPGSLNDGSVQNGGVKDELKAFISDKNDND